MACITPAWSSGKLGLNFKDLHGIPLSLRRYKETICTPEQKPMLTTPESLSPFAPEFEARGFPRSEDPYYLAQMSDPPNKSTVEDSLTS